MALTFRLVLEGGPNEERRYTLTGRDAIVGRAEQGDVVIPDETVSGRHGILRANALGYTYTDLGSRNGSALQRGGQGPLRPLSPAETIQLEAGDRLLLGASDHPVRIRVETIQAPFDAAPNIDRTVVASSPLVDLLHEPPTGVVHLAAQAIAAQTPEALAEAALRFLEVSLSVHTAVVRLMGPGFVTQLGAPPPADLEATARRRAEVARIELDDLQAVVAPLIARGTFHGYLAAWSRTGLGRTDVLEIGAPMVALAVSALAVRTAQEAALADDDRVSEGDPIGSAPRFLQSLDLAKRLAPSDVPLLLVGETGSGKEVLAKLVHRESARAGGPFVAINCGAIPPTLLESELFGHVTGAFTGAGRDHAGVFEQAHGGTLFLDELGEMPLPMQAGILRAIENGEIRRVGDTRTRQVDVRLVSATHRDLVKAVESGSFRADLMYRLDAARIPIPPLRERGEDVILLAHHLLGMEARKTKKRVLGFSPEAILALGAYPFPGNVRELRNEVARAVALTQAGAHVLPSAFSEKLTQRAPTMAEGPGQPRTLKASVEMAERHAVELALARAEGNVTQAAKDLGLSRPGLYKVLVRLGLRSGDSE